VSWSRRTFTCCIGTLVLASSRFARANEQLHIGIAVEPSSVLAGEPVELIVELVRMAGDGALPDPLLPDLSGFEVDGPTTSYSTRTSWINGRASSEARKRFVYQLVPTRPGRFELAVHVEDHGKRIRSNVEVLTVSGTALPESEPQPSTADGKPVHAKGEAFPWASVDKHTVWVGEAITYVLKVYERSRFLNIQLRTLPTFQDFWSEELPEGQPHSELVQGVPFRVHPGMRRVLFPQRAGTLTVGPAEIVVGGRKRVRGQPIAVEVRPLPAEGQPSGFSPNNVGKFTITADIDRNELGVGEPFTLTVTMSGTGNIRSLVPPPWPTIAGIRRYDPKVTTELSTDVPLGGTRKYAFLVIPEQQGELTIAPHRLDFFDPSTGRYESVSTEPIVLRVLAKDGTLAPTDESEPRDPEQNAPEGSDLIPILVGDTLPRTEPVAHWLTPSRWFWAMLSVPTVLATTTLGTWAWIRFGPDERARTRARRLARERELIARARAAVGEGDGFHAALAQLVHGAAVDRAGPSAVGLPRPELLEYLRRANVPGVTLSRLRELLDRCDIARFAGQIGTREERRDLLEQAIELVEALRR